MPSNRTLLAVLAFVLAALAAVGTAAVAAGAIERRSADAVRRALSLDGQSWVEVAADGLVLKLTGTAESEAMRFRALSIAGGVVDATRLIDAMEVRPSEALSAPAFSVEILRNDDGISLIGLIPAGSGREAVVAQVGAMAGGLPVADMLQDADYPAPDDWAAALSFGLEALARLPRSKISITPDSVTVTAITGGAAEKTRIEAELARLAPPGVRLALALSAPRPVITPFTLRFLVDGASARFDACSADTEEARARILAAAVAAGAGGQIGCTLGLGVPSPSWAQAAEAGIAALAELGAGSLTFSDADVSLVVPPEVEQAAFDRVVGELENALPDVFSLTAVRTPAADPSQPEGPPEFTAILAPEGGVQMRGRLTDAAVRGVVESFAVAQFGAGKVYDATRLDAGLPEGWSVRVLAGLDALGELNSGSVLVQPDLVRVRGETGNAEASAQIARRLADDLGEGATFEIDVRYVEKLDPAAGLPTPEECVAGVNDILAARKISFAPGSADIEGDSLQTLDAIARALEHCEDVPIEIAAHSDSQGRDEMNLRLSQERADAVLGGLVARRVLTGNLRAVGYGETRPIADNDTEDGREQNRRIEFTLIAAEAADGSADASGEAAGADAPEAAAGETAEGGGSADASAAEGTTP